MKKVSKKVWFFGLPVLIIVGFFALKLWIAPSLLLVDESNRAWTALNDPYEVVLLQDLLLNNTIDTDQKLAKIVVLVDTSGGDKNKSYELYNLVESGVVSAHEASGAMQGLLSADTTFENKVVYLAAVLYFCQVDESDYSVYLSNKDQFKLILEGKLNHEVMENWIGELFLWLALFLSLTPLGIFLWRLYSLGNNHKKEEKKTT